MSDFNEYEYKLARWMVFRNIALVIVTGLTMYYVSPWSAVLMLFSTSITTGKAAEIKAEKEKEKDG